MVSIVSKVFVRSLGTLGFPGFSGCRAVAAFAWPLMLPVPLPSSGSHAVRRLSQVTTCWNDVNAWSWFVLASWFPRLS